MSSGYVSKSFFEREVKSKILLWCCTVMFFHLLSVVSFATTPQIAQVNLTPNTNRPTLKVGSQGDSVSEVQAALKLLGFYTGTVDGVYNNTTASAVSKFKQAAGLNPDGIVDANTWQQLFPSESAVGSASSSHPETSNTTKAVPTPETKPATKPSKTTPKVVNSNSEPKPANQNTAANSQKPPAQQSSSPHNDPTIQYTQSGLPILRLRMRGAEVVKVQKRLQKLGFYQGSTNGYFGAETEAAVKALQQRYSLEADGVVGGETWQILLRQH